MRVANILCALDLSEATSPVAWAAIRLAEQHQANITFLHVLAATTQTKDLMSLWHPRGGSGGFRLDDVMAAETAESSPRNRIQEFLAEAERRTAGESSIDISRGDPAEEITRYANDGSFDLVVIGGRGESGFLKSLLGSVSYKVVRNVNCSALVVRALPG